MKFTSLDRYIQSFPDDAQKILNQSPWMSTYQSAEGTAALDKEAILKEQDNVRFTPGPRATAMHSRCSPSPSSATASMPS